jgi:retinol-binding protein 3
MNLKPFFIYALALFAFLSLTIKGQDPGQKMTAKEVNMLVDSLSFVINEYYIFPDKAKLMSNAIKAQNKKGKYANAKNRVELCDLIYNDIRAVHKDDHFHFRYDPRLAKDLEKLMTDSDRVQQHRIDLKDQKQNNFAFIKAEILPGNIGFLRWDGFTGMVEEAAPTFKAAFKLVENTNALIIDMRYNGGGSPDMVLHTQNYFFDKKVPMNHIVTRKDTAMRYTDPSKTEFKLKMPVYILTARRTFSGAEDFTYGLKYGNRAIVVGDTTGGGAHPTDVLSVAYGYGFTAHIPFGRSYHEVTKTDWEGTGVRPDVPVNSDHALYKAQTLIYKGLLAETNNDKVKNELRWNCYVAENKISLAKQIFSDSVKVSKETLISYSGVYKPKMEAGNPLITMEVIFKNNNIYRRVKTAPDARLSPVSSTRFVYDDDSGRFIDFILDKDGKVSGVSITRWDGTQFFDKIK